MQHKSIFFNQNKHYLHNVDFTANICYNRNVTIVEKFWL